MSRIMVSVICNSYNHEQYITDALDGIVGQKSTFLFEALVHDDASTDNTQKIIREYQSKFPDIIKPIYQEVNQYSQGIRISSTYQYPRVQGKYIAYCEGDDYWTDPLKLQKQFDAMENHAEIDICTHAAIRVEADTKKVIRVIEPAAHNTIISTDKVIAGGGGFVATSSIFHRSDLNTYIPPFRAIYSYDYTWQIHGSLRGGMLYLSDCMSSYRVGVLGSWSYRMNLDTEKHLSHLLKVKEVLCQLNIDTDEAYSEAINLRILQCDLNILMNSGKVIEIFANKKFHPLISQLSYKKRVGLLVSGLKKIAFQRARKNCRIVK